MTIEEKAKAYDEALERAKAYHRNELAGSRKEMTEYIFPELRESKDERIKSCIGLALTDVNEQRFKDFGITLKDCLSWLEKQKEQKSIESIAAEVTKDKESAIKFLKSASIMDDNGELAEMYRSEPKSTKWSEKDKTMLNNLIWAVHMKSISPLDEMDDRGNYERYEKFLTSLPERFGLKPEREWSEEDERIRKVLYGHFSTGPGDCQFRDTKLSNRQITAFLKSLRPSWKPSEEQMKALQSAEFVYKDGLDNSPVASILESLYSDLQKL